MPMKYDARVTLTRVEYRGDNLGSNIRIRITVSGRFSSLRFRIRPGESRALKQVVYDERTDESEVSLSSSGSATEADPVLDDTGSASAMLRFDASGTQAAVLEVPIQGDRKGDKSKRAILILTFSGVFRETGERFVSLVQREERYWAVTDPRNPIPSGIHDLELPYELHRYGAGYRQQAAFARTWFRVGHSGRDA